MKRRRRPRYGQTRRSFEASLICVLIGALLGRRSKFTVCDSGQASVSLLLPRSGFSSCLDPRQMVHVSAQMSSVYSCSVSFPFFLEFVLRFLDQLLLSSYAFVPAMKFALLPSLRPHDRNAVIHRAGDQSRFTDVIGVLVEISDAKIVHLTGKPNPTITGDIVLRDLTHFEIKVTL
ncbi:hypothetical protein U9M48_036098 [Paspalum notatum var. saurae]|uniref:Uncharacterized protein n=1 Tax=Paspalum notatum var. saurae TaxID=547442 RepID=A0AAQ3UCH4_PASNO